MKRFRARAALLVGLCMGGTFAMAVEEAPYRVVQKEGAFELREYEPQILAEVVVDGDLEDAGNKAFNLLFRYISGENRGRAKIAMTAPVAQERTPEKITMTAPVSQQSAPGGWAVSFMMPSSYTLETLPVPDNPAVVIRQVPARRVAAIRYSGTWSGARYRDHLARLEAWIRASGFVSSGEPVWARYDPPFMPWFLRRNEVLIPVAPPKPESVPAAP
jgi:hypothetical protein